MIALAALVVAATAPALPVDHLRYVRTLRPTAAGPVELVPDGSLYAHAREDFSDVRIADARGRSVPWRPTPQPALTSTQPTATSNAAACFTAAEGRASAAASPATFSRRPGRSRS